MNTEIFEKTKQGKKTVYSFLYTSTFLVCVYDVGVHVLCVCGVCDVVFVLCVCEMWVYVYMCLLCVVWHVCGMCTIVHVCVSVWWGKRVQRGKNKF